MRIIAGDFGGRRLLAPRGLGTRPTSDRVKQALFDVLGPPRRREGAERFRVLDLYAGSGALALEALSRGADEAVLVEEDREAVQIAERNADALEVRGRVRIVKAEVGDALRGLEGVFDWIFLDPPYDKPSIEARAVDKRAKAPGAKHQPSAYGALDRALRLLSGRPLAAGPIVAEHDHRTPPAERYEGRAGTLSLYDRRRWGDTGVSFYSLLGKQGATDGETPPGAAA